MILPSSEPSLEQIILKILSGKPQLSALRLRAVASHGPKKYSQAAVYKVLSRLLAHGVVVKSGTRYSLSLAWVFELLTHADHVAKTYFAGSYISSLIPDKGRKLSWKFNNLSRCNEFWNQLLLALLKHVPAVDVYAWVPLPWFVLLADNRESRLHKAFRMSGRIFYTAFGAAGPFLEDVKTLYDHKNQRVSFAKGPFADLKGSHIDLIGDYILTVTLAPESVKKITNLFSDTRSAASPGRQAALVSQRLGASVSLELAPRRAARLRRNFKEFFGLK